MAKLLIKHVNIFALKSSESYLNEMNIKGKYVRKKRTPVPAAPLFAFLKKVVHKNVKVIVLDAYEKRKSAKKNGFDLSTIP